MQIVTMEYFNLSLSGGTIEKSTEIPNVVVDIYYKIYTPLDILHWFTPLQS